MCTANKQCILAQQTDICMSVELDTFRIQKSVPECDLFITRVLISCAPLTSCTFFIH